MIEIIPLQELPLVEKDDDIGKLILEHYRKNTLEIKKDDIIIIAQVIISKAEGEIVKLDSIEPSSFAKEIAKQSNKDPKHVEVILREAKNICKNRNGVLITETKHGFVCANSGVDKSNVLGDNVVTLLPKDPDKSAKKIRELIEKESGKQIAVIISDTHNRPFRLGAINIAIGCSGINPLNNYVGKKDLYGYKLKSSTTSLADQLCSAAGLQMGEADEGYPVIIIRGIKFEREEISAQNLIRPEERDYFR
ncbi:MAG: coenzyme F420-0:L-glutamate ligase [Candidatus Heimdallarchaeota archaeon]